MNETGIGLLVTFVVLTIIVPMFFAIMLLIMEDATKRTIKLLFIPFGFIILLKEKYNKLDD